MPGLNEVLERLVGDGDFRARLQRDPIGALAGYDLSAEDLELLTSQVSEVAGRSGSVQARTSKAGLFGLLGGVDDLASAITGSDASGGFDPVDVGEPQGSAGGGHGTGKVIMHDD